MLAPAAFAGGELRTEKALEQAHFALALEAPSVHEKEFHTGQVFAVAFGGGMSSRLFQEAREKRGLCYTIFSQASSRAGGAFGKRLVSVGSSTK